jgi:tRNA(Ile)-lysidine synthase TilS/MesJ
MRRGALYTFAIENGFNKVALGHHLDDAVETFFMSMLYNGTLRSMPAIYKSKRGVEIIRPLIKIRESQTDFFAKSNDIPTIGDEACPAMNFKVKYPYNRAKTKELLKNLEAENKDLFTMISSAFTHIQDDTFLDKNRYL